MSMLAMRNIHLFTCLQASCQWLTLVLTQMGHSSSSALPRRRGRCLVVTCIIIPILVVMTVLFRVDIR